METDDTGNYSSARGGCQGIGIPSDHADDVLEDGYTTGGEGTGFGLTIVNEFVKAHGWQIAITESEDGGARFEIYID